MNSITILFLCTILILIGCGNSQGSIDQDGRLDLRNNSEFRDQGFIALKSNWKFLWNKNVSASEVDSLEKEFFPISVRTEWNKQSLPDGTKIPVQGYGIYKINLILNEQDIPLEANAYSLKLPRISAATKVFINRRLVGGTGTIGQNTESEIPFHFPIIYDFSISKDKEIEILIYASNFNNGRGGVWENIFFGKKEQIHLIRDFNFWKESFLIGAVLMIGLYHFGIFFQSRRYSPTLYFGIYCILNAYRISLSGEILFSIFFPDFPFHWKLKAEYISLALIGFFGLQYFRSAFEDLFYKKITKGFQLVLILFSLIVFLAPNQIYVKLLLVLQVLILSTVLYTLYCVIRSVKRKLDSSSIFVSGIFIWAAAVLNDILLNMNLISSVSLIHIGMITFLLTQAFLLSKKFNSAMESVVNLSNELIETSHSYSRFVPKEFLSFLGKSDVTTISLGDVIQTDATVLFCDIRSFTSLTEKSQPDDLFKFLNSYFNEMNKVIIKYNGIIDKYIGDAILAIFPSSVEDSLNCAIEMQRILREKTFHLNQKEIQIEAGVALHYGELRLGVIGGEKLLQTTVISDTVNTCSRLQALTKTYGTAIIVSESILNNLNDPSDYHIRFLDHAAVAGKEGTIFICEVYDHEMENQIRLKEETKNTFDKGVMIYQSGEYEKAWSVFIEILKINPQDSASIFYLNRTATFLVKGITLIHEYDEKLVKWEISWQTGIKIIDEQHMLLFDIINELHKAMKYKREREVFHRILENLKIYVFTHFTMEEELMLRYNYPDFEQHKVEHQKFITTMNDIAFDYNREQKEDPEQILNFLKDWLIAHIKHSDKEGYAPYILAN